MDKEFVRKVLGDEVAERIEPHPSGGFSVMITAKQSKLLTAKFLEKHQGISVTPDTLTLSAKIQKEVFSKEEVQKMNDILETLD